MGRGKGKGGGHTELDGVEGGDFAAESLHDECGHGVADVSIAC